ncbi:F-box only protein 44-like [Liolophura sinensis]|uniref:F-box only protein 44-like n=1 Tax=Liolophura sinensis TaxID=3198878 RepID=UPI003158A60D
MGGNIAKSHIFDRVTATKPSQQQQQHHQVGDQQQVYIADFDMFSFDALPDDILETVLSFVPAKRLLTYRRVGKRWRDIIDGQTLWRNKCERDKVLTENWLRFLYCVHGDHEPINYRQLYFSSPYTRNLIKNPCAKEKLKYWQVRHNGGHGFTSERDHPGSHSITQYAPIKEDVPCWATSFALCQKTQLVDLVAEGCSISVLDRLRPPIHISEWHSARFDCGGVYSLNVQLLAADHTVIDKFDFEIDIPVRRIWEQVQHTFTGYPAGVRFVSFTHGGVDTSFWAGHYGPKFTLSTVKFGLPPEEQQN